MIASPSEGSPTCDPWREHPNPYASACHGSCRIELRAWPPCRFWSLLETGESPFFRIGSDRGELPDGASLKLHGSAGNDCSRKDVLTTLLDFLRDGCESPVRCQYSIEAEYHSAGQPLRSGLVCWNLVIGLVLNRCWNGSGRARHGALPSSNGGDSGSGASRTKQLGCVLSP